MELPRNANIWSGSKIIRGFLDQQHRLPKVAAVAARCLSGPTWRQASRERSWTLLRWVLSALQHALREIKSRNVACQAAYRAISSMLLFVVTRGSKVENPFEILCLTAAKYKVLVKIWEQSS
jgi:hypothetical protein